MTIPPWNEPCRRNLTQHKPNSLLSLALTEQDDRFIDRLASNLEKLTKLKSIECRKDEDPVVNITECVVTSNGMNLSPLAICFFCLLFGPLA